MQLFHSFAAAALLAAIASSVVSCTTTPELPADVVKHRLCLAYPDSPICTDRTEPIE